MTSPLATLSILGLVLAVSPFAGAYAAELRVIAGGSMTGPMNQLAEQFEHATGHKLVIHFDSTPNLIKQATSGAPFDLAVVPIDVFKDEAARARIAAAGCERARKSGYDNDSQETLIVERLRGIVDRRRSGA